jgi:hypothetical protein
MKTYLLISALITCTLIVSCEKEKEEANPVVGPYFGQTPPGDNAVVFAPGIISLPNRDEFSIVFSPDGNEAIYVADKLYYIKCENNKWTDPVIPPFSVNQEIATPIFSSDGKKLYYTKWSSDYSSSHIWMVEHAAGGWGVPQLLPSPINLASFDGGYAETSDSVVYFWSSRSGNSDIWFKRPSSAQAENLGSIINSISTEGSPCIAPDGSYLIFNSGRTGKIGFGDLYVSFSKENNEWTTPVNMNSGGAGINLPIYDQIYPSLSPDGKYLFFQRNKMDAQTDIYWVSTHILDNLKKIAIPTGSEYKAIDQKVKLYPNPANAHINIIFDDTPVREVFVKIFNLQGAQVISKTFQNSTSATIDLTGLTAGIYMVKVIVDGACYVEKILKE